MLRSSLLCFSALTATLSLATPATAQNLDSEIDEIIVTGSPLNRTVDEAITGVSVLSGEDLAQRLATTIGETLKSEPGVSSTFFGAGASRPILRGQGGDRVRILTNGIGSIDASTASPDHAVAVEPAQAERIEVLRGAALLRYGSSGSGGVVNVIDGRIPRELPEEGLDGAVRIGASSVDGGRNVAASVTQGLGKFALHLDGTYKKTDDYNIPGFADSDALRASDGQGDAGRVSGTLKNSAVQAQSVTAGLSYIGARGYLGVAVHNFQTDYGIPAEEDVTIGLDQHRVDVNGRLDLDGFIETLQIFGGYADYEHTEFEAPGEPGTVFSNEGYEIRGEAIQKERGGWSGAYGMQYRERDFAAIGDEAFVPPTNTQELGFYTFQEKEFGDLHLDGAIRYETTDQKNSLTGETLGFDAVSLSAGGDYHLTDAIRFGGTVFRTKRAPTTEELYSNGPHLATEQFELGDSTLGMETATGIEAAIRHRAGGHFITLNAFYTDYKDYVFEQATGATQDGLDVFQFSAEDATFKGFELQGGTHIASFRTFDLKVDALAEYVRAKTESGNLPRIPPFSFLGGVEAESDRLTLRAELEYSAAQKDVGPFETPTGDYALTNFFVTWRAPIEAQPVTISVSLQNAFNVEARQHTSVLKEVVPLPGRNVRVSIGTKF